MDNSFLKNIGHKSIVKGKHLVDSRVYKDIKLVPLSKSRKRAIVIRKPSSCYSCHRVSDRIKAAKASQI